jgi:hypothetical protein
LKRSSSSRISSFPFARLVLILAIVLLVQGTGSAEAIRITGTTAGSFGVGFSSDSFGAGSSSCTPEALGGLNYTCGGFDVMTNSDGEAGIGDVTRDNLGTFALGSAIYTYAGHMFNLSVTIALPAGSSPTATLVLPLKLSVDAVGGGARITGGGPIDFTFPTVGGGTGTLSLSVDSLTLRPGGSAPLTGYIESSGVPIQPVPEPHAVVLIGFGMLAFVVARTRRRAA